MHRETRDTYNQSADKFSRHYDRIGSRDGDVDLAFALAGNPKNAKVLELGCGNGRDALTIMRQTKFYTGIDSSEKMIAIASRKLPEGTLVVGDVVDYPYGGPYDIVFAFALFRHLSLEEVTIVLKKASASLRQGGILYISSMFDEAYKQISRSDVYGNRDMYLYSPKLIMKRCPPSLKKVQEIYDHIDDTEWFELALKKQA